MKNLLLAFLTIIFIVSIIGCSSVEQASKSNQKDTKTVTDTKTIDQNTKSNEENNGWFNGSCDVSGAHITFTDTGRATIIDTNGTCTGKYTYDGKTIVIRSIKTKNGYYVKGTEAESVVYLDYDNKNVANLNDATWYSLLSSDIIFTDGKKTSARFKSVVSLKYGSSETELVFFNDGHWEISAGGQTTHKGEYSVSSGQIFMYDEYGKHSGTFVCINNTLYFSSVVSQMTLQEVSIDENEPDSTKNDVPSTHVHQFTEHPAKEATCTQKGNYAYKTCSCGYTDYKEIPALGHDYSLVETQDSTCESKGYYKYQCQRCKETKTEEKQPLGHNYALTSTQNPSCEESGFKEYTCQRCQKSYREPINALGHEYAFDEHVDPTCENEGYNLYRCIRCSSTQYEYISALGHNYTEATCIVPMTCKNCGQQVGNPLPHNMIFTKCGYCGYSDFSPIVMSTYKLARRSYYSADKYHSPYIDFEEGDASVSIDKNGLCILKLLTNTYVFELDQVEVSNKQVRFDVYYNGELSTVYCRYYMNEGYLSFYYDSYLHLNDVTFAPDYYYFDVYFDCGK